MSKKDKSAELVIILDRSGSMCSIASAMEEAIEILIDNQKETFKGDMKVTFVRFDTEYEEVFSEKPIQEVEKIKVEPRGGTALLDAIGNTLNTVERRYSEKEESERPVRILFFVVSDGEENSSREFTRGKVFGMIRTVERDHDWNVTYVGTNQDAIREGSSIGVSRGSSLNFAATAKGIRSMSQSVGNYATNYFESGKASYDEEEK